MNTVAANHRVRNSILVLTGVMLVAFNLRPALTSVGPVLGDISNSLALPPSIQGVLTTLPVLFLGLAAPLAPRAARRFGVERTVLAAVALLALALVARPYAGAAGLFIGTAVAGACIGVGNVLLPGIVKRDFPDSVSLLTGIYTGVLCMGAALAAGATEPLRTVLGNDWRPALAIWLLPAIVAAAVWWLQLGDKQAPAQRAGQAGSLYRDRLAWQVALYMGLQSSLAYIVYGWLPTILQDRGLTAATAGFASSVSIVFQIVTAIGAPWVGSHMRDQRLVITIVMLLTLIGLGGCIYLPMGGVWLWVAVLGLGQGGAFAMGLTLLAVRARDADTAARLSGMAQCVGYILAAFGPLLVGVLHGVCGNWQIAGVFLGCLGAAGIIAGLGAGRGLYVLDDGNRARRA